MLRLDEDEFYCLKQMVPLQSLTMRISLLFLFLFSLPLSAQHANNRELPVSHAPQIQADMFAGKYDAGDDCSDLYNQNKAKIQSEINYYKRTLDKNPPPGSSSEPYTLYAYMLGLKGRCEKNKASLEEAFDLLELALNLSIANNAPDDKALGFVAKIINGFMEKSENGGFFERQKMKIAARRTFSRFQNQFEAYFRQVPKARRDNSFMGPRILSVYQKMIKL